MKSRILLVSASALALLITIQFALLESGHGAKASDSKESSARPVHKKWSKTVRQSAPIAERERIEEEASDEPAPMMVPDETASLDAWTARFQSLLANADTRENVRAIIAAEVDQSFTAWAEAEIASTAALEEQERLDRLTLAEESVREGAAAIYEQLGLDGGRRVEVAKEALESLAAEIQYSQAAPDHQTRLAMLRLDREKEAKINEALVLNDDSTKEQAMAELDQWYETGMSRLFPENASDE